MTDRPILFSGPMIQALLAGRKTQTRRVLRMPGGRPFENLADIDPQMFSGLPDDPGSWGYSFGDDGGPLALSDTARWQFAIGDRLWVRETVACGECAPGPPSHWAPSFWRREQGTPVNPNGLWYKADGLAPLRPITERGRWVPGIHMPRWASRLTLLVTDVRVERLPMISEADAQAEGATPPPEGHFGDGYCDNYRSSFCDLWDSLNDARGFGWASNPWVVAVTFEVHRANIDVLRLGKAA